MWELDCKESCVSKNWCFWTVVLEKTLESPLDCKEIQPVHSEGDQPWVFLWKDWCWAETPILWPPHVKSWLTGKDWCWEGLGAGEEGDDQGWDGWMVSLTRWAWVWVNSRSWWWTGRPGVLQFMGSQRVRHDWETELNWIVHHWRIKTNLEHSVYPCVIRWIISGYLRKKSRQNSAILLPSCFILKGFEHPSNMRLRGEKYEGFFFAIF